MAENPNPVGSRATFNFQKAVFQALCNIRMANIYMQIKFGTNQSRSGHKWIHLLVYFQDGSHRGFYSQFWTTDDFSGLEMPICTPLWVVFEA